MRRRSLGIAVLAGALVLAGGCVPVGPNSVRSDQVDYADAMSEAIKRLTLTNIIKTRYGDATSYLVASQVVAGYQLQGNVSANLDLVDEGGWGFGDSGSLTVGGQFSNNPTITYTPVAVADFAALLLQPIVPADAYALIASGTPPDLVLGLLVAQINGIRNDLLGPEDVKGRPTVFRELLALAVKLHAAAVFHVRVEGTGKDRKALLVMPKSDPDPGVAESVAQFRKLLGLDPTQDAYPVTYADGSGAPGSIHLLTRSIAQIIRDLASLIEVPAEDVATGRTFATPPASDPARQRVRISARVDRFRPLFRDTYVTAFYRGRWFWIEDTDFRSKEVFSFVIELLQLAQTTSAQSLPVITIPSG